MRHWHRRPFVPVRSGLDTRDQTGREAVSANHGQPHAPVAVNHPAVKSGTHALVATLAGPVTPVTNWHDRRTVCPGLVCGVARGHPSGALMCGQA
jgi:hypothetical protein